MSAGAARQVLALLDDAAPARSVIEMSSAIAHQLQRPLELVYVESTAALLAAALPFAQVLAHGGVGWTPLVPQDVERGYRAQAARLRELAERITVRRSVSWSMRVVRGALTELALEPEHQSDLMLIGTAAGATGAAGLAAPRTSSAEGRPRIAVVADDSEGGRQARQVAQRLAEAMSGLLQVRPAGADLTAAVAASRRCDLLVLPRALVGREVLARLAQPVLLVG